MELTFLGTRGEIEGRSHRHQRHSALLVEHRDVRLMIDCGADWLHRIALVAPTAIVLTHAHPDHAAGLARGAACPVYASSETLELLRRFPIADWRELPAHKAVTIGGLRLRAYRVQHSLRAPAVGFRVFVGACSFFYLPDVADLPGASTALAGIEVYIGDGATVTRSLVRRRDGVLIGHAPVTVQLDWCAAAGVRRAMFTHCGSPIVRGDARVLNALVRDLGRTRGVDASIACDGDRLSLPTTGAASGKRMRTDASANRTPVGTDIQSGRRAAPA